MRRILIVLCLAAVFAACSSGPPSTIDIRYDGQQIPFAENEKSGTQTVQRALYGTSEDIADRRHALRWITLRNYEFDAAKGASNPDKLTSPAQVKIFISIHDDQGTDVDTALQPSVYKGAKSGGGPMSLELVNVYTFKDGKETMIQLYPSQAKDPSACRVTITSADNGVVKGEIEAAGAVNGKDFSIKGPFAAQIVNH